MLSDPIYDTCLCLATIYDFFFKHAFVCIPLLLFGCHLFVSVSLI